MQWDSSNESSREAHFHGQCVFICHVLIKNSHCGNPYAFLVSMYLCYFITLLFFQQVQSELAAALARKTRKACKCIVSTTSSVKEYPWCDFFLQDETTEWQRHAVSEKALMSSCLWLVAVSEQDSETTESSHQEPSTPSEERSPVTHTQISTHTHYRNGTVHFIIFGQSK